MPTRASQPASDPWRDAKGDPLPLRDIPLLDAEGAHIPFQSRVEQIAVDEPRGALRSRLHRQGDVVGRGRQLVYVRFDQEYFSVSLAPHFLRLIDTPETGAPPGGSGHG